MPKIKADNTKWGCNNWNSLGGGEKWYVHFEKIVWKYLRKLLNDLALLLLVINQVNSKLTFTLKTCVTTFLPALFIKKRKTNWKQFRCFTIDK